MRKKHYIEILDEDDYDAQILKDAKTTRKSFKIPLLIIALIIIYISYNNLILYLIQFLNSNPTIHASYLYIQEEIFEGSIKGLLIMATLGSLFFLSLPSELLYIYYLSSSNFQISIIFAVMLIGNMIGLTFNYFFGFVLGQSIMKLIFKKKFETYKQRVLRYGGIVAFIGNIIPGPIEVLSVFYGSFRYPFPKYFLLCFLGRAVKYIILGILFFLFWDQIISYYNNILGEIKILGDIYSD